MDALILTVWTLIKIVAILVPLILCVAYLTLAERKVIGSMQVRVGPNRVGPKGLGQPFADVFILSSDSVAGASFCCLGGHAICRWIGAG